LSSSKYIFITGGVTSSVGKGIISASLAKLLQERGLSVTIQKLDPYINTENKLVEIIEIPEHPWFMGIQFHPEYSSTVMNPHPLFIGLIKSALELKANESKKSMSKKISADSQKQNR